MNCRCVRSAARSRATSALKAVVNCPISSPRTGGPRSSSPVSGTLAARCAITVSGRKPTDASHRPPPAASSNATGMASSSAWRTSC